MPNYKTTVVSVALLSTALVLASSIFAQHNSVQKSKQNEEKLQASREEMPRIVLPVVKAQNGKALYTPGKTNIKDISVSQKIQTEETDPKTSIAAEATISSDKEETTYPLTSAELNKFKTAGLLSSLNSILTAKNPTLTAVVSELKNVKAKWGTETTNSKTDLFQEASNNVDIIRFLINNEDIQSCCQNLYFSGIEQSGAFLLTGDFKYNSKDRPCVETFYFLFSANGTKGGQSVYKVTSSVEQKLINDKSPLLALSKTEDLTASKTGGFVSIHNFSKSVSVDFLLSLNNTDLTKAK